MREDIFGRGKVRLRLRRSDGGVFIAEAPNLITNAGWDLLCDVLGKTAQPSDLTHIAIGSGSTAAAATDTALVTELARITATYAHVAGTKVMTLTGDGCGGDGDGHGSRGRGA